VTKNLASCVFINVRPLNYLGNMYIKSLTKVLPSVVVIVAAVAVVIAVVFVFVVDVDVVVLLMLLLGSQYHQQIID
jgi:hypothetical protein